LTSVGPEGADSCSNDVPVRRADRNGTRRPVESFMKIAARRIVVSRQDRLADPVVELGRRRLDIDVPTAARRTPRAGSTPANSARALGGGHAAYQWVARIAV